MSVHQDTDEKARLKAKISKRFLQSVSSLAIKSSLVASATLLASVTAASAQMVGDTIVNPSTGGNETVVAVFDEVVLTDANNLIVTNLMVGAVVVDPNADPDDPMPPMLTVTELVMNPTTMLVDMYKASDGGMPEVIMTYPVVRDASSEVDDLDMQAGAGVDDGDMGGDYTLPPAVGDVNTYRDAKFGSNGSGGRNGGGVRICIFKCFTIGVSAKNGTGGGNGPGITVNDHGPIAIQTVSANSPGVIVTSTGGNGGKGGNGYVAVPAASGGPGGHGGTIIFTTNAGTTISTNGNFSHGILAQSRGGAGGAGGSGYGIVAPAGAGGTAGNGGSATVTNNGSISTIGNGAMGILVQSLGGFAGGGGDSFGIVGSGGGSNVGGNGGSATGINAGSITTTGIASHGVLAQSIGGSGGDAGNAGGLFADASGGSAGGTGGAATARNTGASARIETSGLGAIGLFAQSVGGGGGNGGTTGGVVAFGSSGAGGGAGGTVTVENLAGGTIITHNIGAIGMFAQSIGGGGGQGGAGGGLVSFGGSGSTGSNGGSVFAYNRGTSSIETDGDAAYGIFAQSVGGGGGNGGASGGVAAFGGSGSGGGSGGAVTVLTEAGGSIATHGQSAHGIFAESIGGGGGAGASSGGLVALGGGAGGASGAGTVTVTNGGTIDTTGIDARGVFAQSVGGGGGSANGTGGLVAIGGTGGSGGAGGVVTVTNTGEVTTTMSGADALFVQSIGGGGGSGASSGGVVALGGSAGSGGGAGGAVTVTNSGELETAGDRARGIFAQSVGGGGGSGGESGGLVSLGGNGSVASLGGTVMVSNTGSIITQGNVANAIHAQSLGGGGGDGGTSGGVFFTLGGKGAGGGDGGIVTVGHSGEIETVLNDSNGIFAQSVGGGGGNGGNAASGSAFAGVAIGGDGAGGGIGNTTTVNFSNYNLMVGGVTQSVAPLIITDGDRSKGVFAQSVGGGGGNGGFAVQATAGYSASVSVAVGGNGAGGGMGGATNINGNVRIQTDGEDSDGMFAQSVGGGGGNGGYATSISLAAGETAAFSVSVGVGGKGGAGGDGGQVTLRTGGSILTEGALSEGLIAQSVGGGGGNGGFSVSVSGAGAGAASGAIAVGVGGTGGMGGVGGAVDVEYGGSVTTTGLNSDGVLIQSVGGGGGNGGFNVSGSVAGAGAASGAVAVGIGGGGGGGGNAGTVRGVFTGNIGTTGEGSDAFIAQSIGGSGGNGGFNVSGTLSGAGTASGAVSVGIGGAGAGAGTGNTVNASLTGDLMTMGLDSTAFLAQSVGGGGGNGAFNVSGALSFAGTGAAGASVGVGGAGGGGGNAGNVTADVLGDITTVMDRSEAFIAQSVGGGGGNGGFNVSAVLQAAGTGAAGVSVGVGGSGGGAGDGMTVDAGVTGDIITMGNDAGGFLAQSVGGGGGNGAFNVSGAISFAGTAAGSIGVGVGGSGGDGGDGGVVIADHIGDIGTMGDRANGFVAQSVGGGGGNGGFNVSAIIQGAGTGAAGASIGVGGSGGGGGDSNTVDASVTGNVTTMGRESDGILAQSVGGGGGNGGFNVSGNISAAGKGAIGVSVGVGGAGGDGGDAMSAELDVDGDVMTAGIGADGITVQSLGGGGGNGGFNVTGTLSASGTGAGSVGVGVGGSGGGGGNAQLARGTVIGDVTTVEENAKGVIVQSLGGGGGNGGFNITGNITASKSFAGSIGVGVGGFGGDGGDGGMANGSVTGDIMTMGDDSSAFLVQSVGGGGGNGGMNITANLTASMSAAGSLGVGIGGFGGDGGNASSVIGYYDGDITTVGEASSGITYQSLGGGGGNGAMNITGTVQLSKGTSGSVGVGVGGFGGDGGDASTVMATANGAIETFGVGAYGILTQSLGGGGGNGGINVTGTMNFSLGTSIGASVGIGGFGGGGGNANNVTFNREGLTTTHGTEADGITVQSLGGGGGNGAVNVSGALAFTTSGTSVAAALGLGGFGGDGGDAGTVMATIEGDVFAGALSFEGEETNEDGVNEYVRRGGANGVVAQSVGGSGGKGGVNVSAGVSVGSPSSGTNGALTLGVGGFGGGGGDANTATLNLTADDVVAIGDGNHAVAVQSIGGGGGMGGTNISGSITMDGSLTLGMGGFGGDGGISQLVSGMISSDLTARGKGSIGLLAQSVGGGGGDGGVNISGGIQPSTDASQPSLVFGLGGFGGAGNISGDVDITQLGTIFVEGVQAKGIVAQSIAGGGGNGGFNVSGNIALGDGIAASIGVGGSGGTGANAGDAKLTSNGDIMIDARTIDQINGVEGDEDADLTPAFGVLVQSVGGGGGNGGFNVAGVISPSGSPVAVGVGGTGSGGGDGGDVDVDRGLVAAGMIMTMGDNASGLVAQSIGGGGGNAGMNIVGSATQDGDYAAKLLIGGAGGDPGHGGLVEVDHLGDIHTLGNNSHGMFAQSVGGGGGQAAVNLGLGIIGDDTTAVDIAVGGAPGDGGNGGVVMIDHGGIITTAGDDSHAIFAQSVGGGGGSAASNLLYNAFGSTAVSVGIGRMGGTGGIGGNVSVESEGTLMTTGERSVGIFAQSVGNGGGASQTISISAEASSGDGDSKSSTGFELAVGLDGGMGGMAGDVDVTASGLIMTTGEESHGIHAQSIGGGGGDGGSAAVDLTQELIGNVTGGSDPSDDNSFSLMIGGTGGTGAEGGMVTVDNFAMILTESDKAFGVNAQSVGGGGGAGGMVFSGALAGEGNSNKMEIGIGGSGGMGGTGGDVNITNEGIIHTMGLESHGLRAQSIGGGGGDAGLVGNVSIARPGSDASSNSIVVNIGGTGGDGGTGGAVSVINRPDMGGNGGTILTEGKEAHGIFAQSIGGGGGNGSSIVSANFAGGMDSASIGVNIGGDGGSGNAGGTVMVDNSGQIETMGEGAHGVYAQSIGGGGGNGGMALALNAVLAADPMGGSTTPLVVLGGSGGDGADAAAVTVTNSGSILTHGVNAHGIVAQSIGGGGGNAGIGIGITNNPVTAVIANALSAALGGRGGTGGMGGVVTVNHSGNITVMGDGAQAIKAESINGGGGGVVMDFNGITSLPGGSFLPTGTTFGVTTDPVLTISAGGQQTMNSTAGAVNLNVTGTFGVVGDNGAGGGIQAIGGGGGNIQLRLKIDDDNISASDPLQFVGSLGGEDGQNNNGGVIMSMHDGDIVTMGRNTPGLYLQSIGGGGGRGNFSIFTSFEEIGGITLGLGGINGLNEMGGDITHTQTGSLFSMGDQSFGVFAQSVGGGGGEINFFIGEEEEDVITATAPIKAQQSAAIRAEDETSSDAPVQSKFGSAAMMPMPMTADVELGAMGGSGLDGGDVNFTMNGDSNTTGDNSVALFFQSVGAGGGDARISGVETVNVTLGGSGGASGNGGGVSLTNNGSVSTTGLRAHGVFLQSVGGGGGSVFTDSTDINLILSSDNTGNGGDIDLEQNGDVITEGTETFGIFLQTVGGGGGFVDSTFMGSAGGTGAGGSITADIDGQVVTMGDDSTGLVAQSVGDSGGNIAITLATDGLIIGGSGGTGVAFDGGASNSLVNGGLITTLDEIDGLAISGTTGDEAIFNDGIVAGDIDVGAGANSFTNNAGGELMSGAIVNLGDSANLLRNDGLLTPGGADRGLETNLSGSFLQSSGGFSMFELDFESDMVDSILATGTSSLDGAVDITLVNIPVIKPGEYQKILYSGALGLTDNGILLTTPDSVVINFDPLIVTPTTAELGYEIDFAPDGLVGNRIDIGEYINRAQTAGSAPSLANTIIALVTEIDFDNYSDSLTQLGPEFYAEQQVNALRGAQMFAREMRRCGSFTYSRKVGENDRCVWSELDIDSMERTSETGFPRARHEGIRFSGGVQYGRGEGWTFGAGASFSSYESTGYGGRWYGESTYEQFGVSASKRMGETVVGGVLTAGFGDYESERHISVTQDTTARSDRDMFFYSGLLGVSHTLQGSGFVFTPNLDFGFAHMGSGAFAESGAIDGQNLALDKDRDIHVWVQPGFELEFVYKTAGGASIRPFGGLSLQHFLTNAYTEAPGRFRDAPAGVAPMVVTSRLDRTHVVGEAGLELRSPNGISFRMAYERDDSDFRKSETGSVRLVVPFN